MRSLLVCSLALSLAACSPSPAAAPASGTGSTMTWPTKGWPSSTPDAEGLDGPTLSALDAEFASGKRGQMTSMLVIRHGKVVFDKLYSHDFDKLFEGRDPVRGPYNYYDPDWHPFYKHGKLHTMQSVSKSFTSALVGIAIGRGELPAVQTKAMPMFEGFKIPDADPRRADMTLENVLTMTTGIEVGREHGHLYRPGEQLREHGAQRRLVRRARPAAGRRAGNEVRLQQRRHRTALVIDQEGDRQAGARVRRRAPVRAARDHRHLLEDDAEGARRHRGRAVHRVS